MEDNWTPPSDAEVADWTPPSDAQVVDEPVKKKVTPSPSLTQSSSSGLNLLSGVIPSGKALLTGEKEQVDLTNAPIAEDESNRSDKFIRKPIDKKKVEEVYALSKQNESLVDEFAKSHFVLDNLSQTEAIKQLNDLYAKREQAKDPQTAQAIDDQIEVLKSQPIEKQPSIQEAILQNAQKYGSQPQDFNRPEIPMNPLTPNQILKRNGMKTANTVGELHDRYIESANKLNQLRPELDKTATELDKFKKEARTADFKTDKSGNKTLEGLADVPEAFGHGFGGTMKSIEQGFVNLLGDKQDRIDYAKKRYLEDNVLYPTRTKGMLTSGSEMVGGVAPYAISTAVLSETGLLGHVIINGLIMGVSGYGNGYYEMFAKQKQQGRSDEEADAIAMQNAKFEGAKETAIGASLPFMGGAGSKLFLAPAEKSAMKEFLATQGVIIPTFTAGKLASNTFQKYGLGEKDVNLGDGLTETAENGLILGAMMEFAHKAPTKLKEMYRANISEQYPSIQQAVDKAVQDGVMDASQASAFTEKLKRDYSVFNAMPKDITTEQKLAIEPEVKQIIELSNREPSAVENPEVTKDKIVQLQKQVAEKLGTPLTEKEQKSYEKLQERQKPIKSESGKEITLELLPSEKAELTHYEKRIETAKENEVKLAEQKKQEDNDKKNIAGVQGSERIGEEPIQTEPNKTSSGETSETSGNVLQNEQEEVEVVSGSALRDVPQFAAKSDKHFEYVPIEEVDTYKEFDRETDKKFDKKELDDLTEDIRVNGIKKPIQIKVDSNGKALIVEGNTRLAAAKRLGIKNIPVEIIEGEFGSINKEKTKALPDVGRGELQRRQQTELGLKDNNGAYSKGFTKVEAPTQYTEAATLKEQPKAETNPQEEALKPFADIINESGSFEEAFNKVRGIKDVPQETADMFSQKYATEEGVSPEQAFRKFYDEVKSQKLQESATSEPSLSQKENKFVTEEGSFEDAKKEYESVKEKYKKHLKKDGEFRVNTPNEVKKEIGDAYSKMKTLIKQERERLVSEDKRDTGLFDGIDRIRDNPSAFNLVKISMGRGLIPERLYNEFGKNLLHIVAESKDVNEVTAQTAEIIQDFMNRENIKADDTIARELQVAENLRFETIEDQSIFEKYDLSTLENKPSERKKAIEQAVAEIKQSAPEKAERVREIMTNFDKLKTKLQGLDERVTKIKIEC